MASTIRNILWRRIPRRCITYNLRRAGSLGEIQLRMCRAHVSSNETLVEKGTLYATFQSLSDIKHQRCVEIYNHGIHWNILYYLPVLKRGNNRRYGKYMDLRFGQLFRGRLVFPNDRSILHGLFQYLDHSFLCVHHFWPSFQCHPSISVQNGWFRSRSRGELYVDSYVYHLLWRFEYAHLMGSNLLPPFN